MKVKSLALLLSAGLFAATASATSVVLYGSLDAAVAGHQEINKQDSTNAATTTIDGKVVTSIKGNPQDVNALLGVLNLSQTNSQKVSSIKSSLQNGFYTGSKLGFKGEANVTASSVAGFQLEMGFDSTTANLSSKFPNIFNRGAFVYVKGDFGRLSLGYMPDLLSGAGPNNAYTRASNPFVNAGAGANTGFIGNAGAKWQNTVVYQSPVIAGLQLSALFSPDATGNGGKFKNNLRVGQVALGFTGGPVQLVLAGSARFYPKGQTIEGDAKGSGVDRTYAAFATPGFGSSPVSTTKKDAKAVFLGGNVALGDHVKVFASGQKTWSGSQNLNGWAATAGLSLNFGNNTLAANFGYSKQELNGATTAVVPAEHGTTSKTNRSVDFNQKTVAAQLRYSYALTKYATLYLGADYSKVESTGNYVESSDLGKMNLKLNQITKYSTTATDTRGYLGMSYRF